MDSCPVVPWAVWREAEKARRLESVVRDPPNWRQVNWRSLFQDTLERHTLYFRVNNVFPPPEAELLFSDTKTRFRYRNKIYLLRRNKYLFVNWNPGWKSETRDLYFYSYPPSSEIKTLPVIKDGSSAWISLDETLPQSIYIRASETNFLQIRIVDLY